MIHFKGHSDGKVIVPDEPVSLPRDTDLEITVRAVDRTSNGPASRDEILRIAAKAEEIGGDLPIDLAEQHDHYLYGTPKQ